MNKMDSCKTTYTRVECPHNNAVIPWGTFRFSIEEVARIDPTPNELGNRAAYTLGQCCVTKPRFRRFKKGVGAWGDERWCLGCMDALVAEVHRCRAQNDPNFDMPPWSPLLSESHWIFPEERSIPGFLKCCTLFSPFRYALEKCKTIKLLGHSALLFPASIS